MTVITMKLTPVNRLRIPKRLCRGEGFCVPRKQATLRADVKQLRARLAGQPAAAALAEQETRQALGVAEQRAAEAERTTWEKRRSWVIAQNRLMAPLN